MTVMRSIAAVSACLLALAVGMAIHAQPPTPSGPFRLPSTNPATPCEARIPISSLPFTISACGSYFLTDCLTGTSGADGITIASLGEVTIDLNGYALVGSAGSGSAILAQPPAGESHVLNVQILNGTIADWDGAGLNLQLARNSRVERVSVSGCDTGILIHSGIIEATAIDACNTGIECFTSTVRDCVIRRCTQRGILGHSSIVRGCLVDGLPDSRGVEVDSECLVENNAISNNLPGVGLLVTGSQNHVRENSFVDNGTAVDSAASGGSNLIVANSTTNGAFSFHASDKAGPTDQNPASSSNPWSNLVY